MSEFAKTVAIMVVGGAVGVGGFAFLTQEQDAEAVAPPVQVAPAPAEELAKPTPPLAAAQPRSVVSVETSTTGGVEPQRSGTSFAVFDVRTAEDVADVELVVTGGVGARPVEAVGYDFSASGDALKIDLGDIHGSSAERVVVALELTREHGEFSYHTNHRQLHGEREKVTGASTDRGISRKLPDPAVYEVVRRAYSEDAIDRVHELMDDGEFRDALAWTEDTYATNVEVGMSLRLTGELDGYQGTLNGLKAEIKEALKPQKKLRPKPKKKDTIVVMRLDES